MVRFSSVIVFRILLLSATLFPLDACSSKLSSSNDALPSGAGSAHAPAQLYPGARLMFRKLWSFHRGTGAGPNGAVPGRNGEIFGTFSAGPVKTGQPFHYRTGGVFVLRPGSGGYTQDQHFIRTWNKLGLIGTGEPVLDAHGDLWTMTTQGAVEFTISDGVWSATLQYLCGHAGRLPSPLTITPDGSVYGVCNLPDRVFKLTPKGSGYTAETLYTAKSTIFFTGGLAVDAAGDVLGTTLEGGTGYGTVFEILPGGLYVDLYDFSVVPNKSYGPLPHGLFLGPTGALYGLTSYGGPQNNGTVYTMTPSPSGYRYALIDNVQNGVNPFGLPYVDPSGKVYFTTYSGNTIDLLTPNGGSYTETLIHKFSNPVDGDGPSRVLAPDAHGNLYGSTLAGGSSRCGCGTVFELTP